MGENPHFFSRSNVKLFLHPLVIKTKLLSAFYHDFVLLHQKASLLCVGSELLAW